MSDTPRTDGAAVGKWLVGDTNVEMVRADFARQLEREIAALEVENLNLQHDLDRAQHPS